LVSEDDIKVTERLIKSSMHAEKVDAFLLLKCTDIFARYII